MLYYWKIVRIFKWDTVNSYGSMGYKTTSGQIWRTEKKSEIFNWTGHFIVLAQVFSHNFCLFFFQTSKFELWQVCSTLSHKDAQYLISKSSQLLNGIVSSQEWTSSFTVCQLWNIHRNPNKIFFNQFSIFAKLIQKRIFSFFKP